MKKTLISILGGLAMSSTALATVYEVPMVWRTTGNELTMQQANDLCNPEGGDTILLVDPADRNNYAPLIAGAIIRNPCTITSASNFYGVDSPILVTNGATVVVDGISLNGGLNQDYMIKAEGTANLTIKNCTPTRAYNSIVDNTSGNLTVEDNFFPEAQNFNQTSVFVMNPEGTTTVQRNVILGSGNAVYVSNENNVTCGTVDVMNNTIHSGNRGVVYNSGLEDLIGCCINNSISCCSADGVCFQENAPNVLVSNNNEYVPPTGESFSLKSLSTSNNFTFDPMYVNPDEDNFALSPESPLNYSGLYLEGKTTYLDPNHPYIGAIGSYIPEPSAGLIGLLGGALILAGRGKHDE